MLLIVLIVSKLLSVVASVLLNIINNTSLPLSAHNLYICQLVLLATAYGSRQKSNPSCAPVEVLLKGGMKERV